MRFAKVNGEKLLEFTGDLKAHGDQNKNNLNSRYNKLNGNRKSQVDAVFNKTEAKSSNKDLLAVKVKRDIVRFSVI